MMTKYLIILSLIILHPVIRSQDVEYAKKIIGTLSSPEFHGRGYVNNGLAVSAVFIQKEFENAGLKSLFNDYNQHFTISVNTFPGKVGLSLGSKSLAPVSEFLVDPASPCLSGSFPAVYIKSSTLTKHKVLNKKLTKAGKKFIIIDSRGQTGSKHKNSEINDDIIKIFKYDPRFQITGVIELTDKKLSWNVSAEQAPRPSFLVNTDSLPISFDSVKTDIENRYYKAYPVSNLAGYFPGKLFPDTFIVLAAHYDHLGRMGNDTYFPGANDNASGVAMMLNLAKHYSENQPDFSVMFIAFTGEEAGLLGSEYFVNNSPIDLKKIKFLINLDLVGHGEEGITVVNGSVHTQQFKSISTINQSSTYFPVVKARGEACNSDHCPFHKAGVSCFFIYTLGGTGAYHDLKDDFGSLNFLKYNELFRLITEFVASF